jgi:hypothetical protein
MPRVGFEPTIPAFERAKAIHGLDRAATVIGKVNYYGSENTLQYITNVKFYYVFMALNFHKADSFLKICITATDSNFIGGRKKEEKRHTDDTTNVAGLKVVTVDCSQK